MSCCPAKIIVVTITMLMLFVIPGFAVASGYQLPPQPLVDLIDAPWTPRVSISPDGEWILLRQYPGYPSIEEVAQPELRLAGLRMNPRTNGPSRGWYLTDLTLKKIDGGEEFPITGLPEVRHFTEVKWSADGRNIAFLNTSNGKINLWVVSVEDKSARQLSEIALNNVQGNAYEWFSDNQTFLVKSIPEGRGAAPIKSLVPLGPILQENRGGKKPARTYQDMLSNAYDESVFEYYLGSQLIKINLSGETTAVGEAALYVGFDPSPDGKYILVDVVHPPYSYSVPYYRFPMKSEVWDSEGKVVYEVADLPLAENISIAYGSVRTGRRSIGWRSDVGAQLVWVEAKDNGDAGVESELRDELFLYDIRSTEKPVSLLELPVRYSGVTWGNDNLALVRGSWWKTRKLQSWLVQPGNLSKEPELLVDRSWEDRYSDPGTALLTRNKFGRSVLLTDKSGEKLFLRGDGASPEGNRPFLDEFDLETHETKRLFHSKSPYYERPVKFLDVDKKILLFSRESVSEPTNYFIRSLDNNSEEQITMFPHPYPVLRDVKKEIVRYTRSDSVQLTGTLYLPADYSADKGPLPMLMWAYPREYKSADAAGQVTGSPYKFVRTTAHSPLLWLSMGYAVFDHPSMPVVGEGDDEPNDTFVEQLVASAQAAVDKMVELGIADREKIAIGGHSYGAFMTANLLAHSDLFRLGIARSGAYNRTLTPYGFQSEERTLWESPEIYFAMSPFMHAEKINEPLLLIHGEADNNSGTYPLQSERFFAALKGHGATTKLVMLPHESHGYRARESILHMLYESNLWMDEFVKNATPRELFKTEKEVGSSH